MRSALEFAYTSFIEGDSDLYKYDRTKWLLVFTDGVPTKNEEPCVDGRPYGKIRNLVDSKAFSVFLSQQGKPGVF